MLKLFFWVLLAANVVLFVFQQTYFDAPSTGKREPERLNYQYKEDQIRPLSADEVNRALAKANVAAEDQDSSLNTVKQNKSINMADQDKPVAGSCVEIGQFKTAEANAFEQAISRLSLNPQNIHLYSVQESSTYMVLIPPSANQKAAEAKIAELKEKNIESYYLIKDQTKLRWAISLGVFKTKDAAVNFATELEKTGLSDLQIVPRGIKTEKQVYRLDHINDEQLKTLQTVLGHFPGQSIQYCQPLPENPA